MSVATSHALEAAAAELFAGMLSPGVVTVLHRTPTCTCSWTGRRRAALFLARHDAWMHAATTGCMPGVPFVSD
jgi:hypothetical protein